MPKIAKATLMLVVALSVACGRQGGMMGERGHMSGHDMMEMMRDPEVMDGWMDEMMRDPRMMARVMEEMHRRMRAGEADGVPLYSPMMGYTPENPPPLESAYEPGSLSARELFERKCSQCHALPYPSRHTVAEWEQTVERMSGYIDSVQFMSATSDEVAEILGYLRQTAAER